MRRSRGFTLMEIVLVVGIVGVLATLAAHGVRRYAMHAKTAEARNALGQMAAGAQTAFAREVMPPGVLSASGSAAASSCLCARATAGVPAVGIPAARKYQSAPSEWTVDASTPGKGFACLKFSMADAQYYRYAMEAVPVGSSMCVPGASMRAMATGDLDGDGLVSQLSITTEIGADGALYVAPNIAEMNPDE